MSRTSALSSVAIAALVASAALAQDQSAQELLHDVLSHYRSLETYTATVVVNMDMETVRDMDLPVPPSETQRTTIRFARPNRVYGETKQEIFACDGKTLVYAIPATMKCFAMEAPANLNDGLQQARRMMGRGHEPVLLLDPVFLLTHDEADAREFVSSLDEVTAERVDRNGVSLVRVAAVMPGRSFSGLMAGGPGVPAELWIDPERRLIVRHEMDMTKASNELMKRLGGQDRPIAAKAIAKCELQEQTLDAVFDEKAFVYDWAGNGYEKISDDSGRAIVSGSRRSPLLGAPAPQIEGKTLGDEPFKLSDLRGNVVVLDFWATWCRPCVQAIPKIQAVHERFAGRPVRVIGISEDRPGTEGSVRKFLETKKITFPQVVDDRGRIGQPYQVRTIPMTVIIDQTGVVQAVHRGAVSEEDLAKQIETLLGGGALITEQDREGPAAPK